MVGGGGEQRTLRIAATHADMTHWFPLGLEILQHKTEVLAGYCEAIGRDPATIERTMAAPVIVAGSDAEAQAALERIPPERRPFVAVGPPEQMADRIRPYLDAGFTGFTFNNSVYRTPEAIAQRRRAAAPDRRLGRRSGTARAGVRCGGTTWSRSVTLAACVLAVTLTVPLGVAR